MLLQDMMEVGNPDDHAGGDSFGVPGKITNRLTLDEQTAHFSRWAALKSPLVIGVSGQFIAHARLPRHEKSKVLCLDFPVGNYLTTRL